MRFIAICSLLFLCVGPALAQSLPNSFSIYVDNLGSSDRSNRDIDAIALTVAKPVKQLDPFTFGIHAGVISTSGRSIEPQDLFYSSADSFGVFTGGYLRLGPTEPAFISPFVEGGIALLLTDRPFPDNPRLSGSEGRIYGKFDIRWGVGLALQEDIQMEVAFALNHISNGSGFGAQNINYDGIGLSLGLRRIW